MSASRPEPTETALQAPDFPAFAAAVRDACALPLRARDVEALARTLRALPGEPEAVVALVGNVTLDLLPAHVEVRAAEGGVRASCWVAPFDQHQQLVLDPASELLARDPDLVFCALDLAALAPDAGRRFATLDEAARASLREEVLDGVAAWATRASGKLSGVIAVANFPRPVATAGGIAEGKGGGETEFYAELNLALARRLRDVPRVHVLDLERLLLATGVERGIDPRMALMAKMPWAAPLLRQVGAELARFLVGARGRTVKCIVLDLDNTLWGGVVGEDGVSGVKIGPGDAVSEAYTRFQERLQALQGRGILLAACSKNNPEDALEVFRERREMVLREEDFAAMEISWDPKYQAIGRLARTLNIGLDSMLFLDDNPAEVELVRQALPQVRSVRLPGDPGAYVGVLDRRVDLDKLEILAADRAKTAQYRAQGERAKLKDDFADLGAYLRSLETRVEIRPAAAADVPRVHQLFTKTNQFNVTTKRYAQGEVEAFLADDRYRLDVVSAADRFGDLGVIGLVLLDGAHVDSFVLSCRAMGRGVETAVMNHVKRVVLVDGEAAELTAAYRPTPKNAPVATLFEDQGFAVAREDGGAKDYRLAAGDARPADCDWIEVTTRER